MNTSAEFPRRPTPIAVESIHGFERRFAACAHQQRIDSFRRLAGWQFLGPLSPMSKWESMAKIAQVDVSELLNMRWMPPKHSRQQKFVQFCGHKLGFKLVHHDTMPFCPECLAEASTPERRVLRQLWHLKTMCACPRHGSLLVEQCDKCGETFRPSRKTKIWSCICGRKMTRIRSDKAPEGAVRMSAIFMQLCEAEAIKEHAGLFQHTTLPEPFARLGLNDLVLVSAKLGLLSSEEATDDGPISADTRLYRGHALHADVSKSQMAGMMNAAYRVMVDWPNGACELFEQLAGRNAEPEVEHPVRALFATMAGYRLLGPLISSDGAKITVIDDALRDWLFASKGIYLDNRQRAKTSDAAGLAIDIADALRRLEGRSGGIRSIKPWIDARAVIPIGSKVQLESVIDTIETINSLGCAELDDAISFCDLHTVRSFGRNFTKADVIRELMAGKIAVQKYKAGNEGGDLLISLSDVNRRVQTQSAS